MSPPMGRYGYITADGKPIWYANIDESGHPYYDPEDPRPFTMGAIITGRPLDAYRILSEESDRRCRNMMGERKHTRSNGKLDAELMESIDDEGFALLVTSQPMLNPTDYSKENGNAVYAGVLSRLLNSIADNGPEGLYRIRIDESEYLTPDLLETIAKAAFDGRNGRELVKRSPVRMYDSMFDPQIQVADGFIGSYRRALASGHGEEFASRNRLFVANRKSSEGLGPAVSRSFKTDGPDSGDSLTWVKPYPSGRRRTGRPRSTDKEGMCGIRRMPRDGQSRHEKRSIFGSPRRSLS